MPVILVFAACAFASGFGLRVVDPIVLPLSAHFGVSPAAVAGLVTAYALPYAIAQPLLGPLGDRFGKATLIRWCSAGLAVMLALGCVAPSFEALVATRIGAGAFAGGLIPLVLAYVGDAYALANRQVVIGRMLFAIVGGQMLGSVVSGIVNARLGWQAVLVTAAAIGVAAAALAAARLPRDVVAAASRQDVGTLYASVFANPKALWLFGAVFVEGAAIYGAFPFMAELLIALTSADRAAVSVETGLVLGAFGIGGLVYAASVRLLLRRLGMRGLCVVGAGGAAAGYASIAVWTVWWLDAAAMFAIGLAFYMLHSSLQTEATEIAPSARGSAFALFAGAFFAGQGIGPLLFGPLLHGLGARPAVLALSIVLVGLGWIVIARVIGPPAGSPARES